MQFQPHILKNKRNKGIKHKILIFSVCL